MKSKIRSYKNKQEKWIRSNINNKIKKYVKELNTFRDKSSIGWSCSYLTEDEKKREFKVKNYRCVQKILKEFLGKEL